ncbi:hypothetical protein VTO42DRAFT_5895 [Malbranchea cinnamomea]
MVSHPESASTDRVQDQTIMALRPALVPVPDNNVNTPQIPATPASVASSRPQHHPPHHSHPRSRSRHGGGTGRSHYGGTSSHAHLNEFPIFSATGDVEIVIRASNQERRYLLHRLILSQCSGFFEAGMSEEWGGSPGTTMRPRANSQATSDQLSTVNEDGESEGLAAGPSRPVPRPAKTRWRYELDWENREEDELPILVQKPPTANNAAFHGEMSTHPPAASRSNKPTTPRQGFFRTMANWTGFQSALHLPSTAAAAVEEPVDPTIRDYDNLFRIFYNYPPQLNSVNIATAYAECKSLLTLADMYDALPVVGPRVDHHLLRFSSRLYKQIAKYPPSYLKLGYMARSKVIFAESLIHVVGQWPAALPHLGPSSYSPVPDAVLDLIEDKVDDLDDAIARVESKLFRLTLTTSRGERVNPFNAYLDWLAVSLFRQWLVENTTPPPASILKSSPSQPGQNVVNSNSSNNNNNNNNSNNATTVPSHQTPSSRQPSASSSSNPSSRPNSGSGHRASNNNNNNNTSKQPAQPFSIGRTYRLLGSPSNQAYLPHDELKRFLKLHPHLYSRENMKRFERKMDEIKRLAREIVKPLMRNFLELDLRALAGNSDTAGDGGGILLPYLTCTKVEESDFPWD